MSAQGRLRLYNETCSAEVLKILYSAWKLFQPKRENPRDWSLKGERNK